LRLIDLYPELSLISAKQYKYLVAEIKENISNLQIFSEYFSYMGLDEESIYEALGNRPYF
jgi:hypothetical protein